MHTLLKRNGHIGHRHRVFHRLAPGPRRMEIEKTFGSRGAFVEQVQIHTGRRMPAQQTLDQHADTEHTEPEAGQSPAPVGHALDRRAVLSSKTG